MPYFKHTGMISSRHPFHGYGANDPTGEAAKIYSPTDFGPDAIDAYDFYTGDLDKAHVGIRGYGDETILDNIKSARPLIKGGLTGLVGYGVMRAVGIQNKPAFKAALMLGSLEAAVIALGGWLRHEVAELNEAQQTPTPAIQIPQAKIIE